MDDQGNAYVGAAFSGYIGVAPFPAKEIGFPLLSDGGSLNFLKVNSKGSALVWSTGLGPGGSVDALTVLPDGQTHALVAFDSSGETLVAISADGNRIEGANYLAGAAQQTFYGPLFLAKAAGVSAPLRMLVSLSSSRIPVAFNDQTLTPVVVDFASPPPQADLSVDIKLLHPVPIGSGVIDVLVTVRNHGPADAEGIQVPAWGQIACIPDGIAICNEYGALIPKLAPGQAMNIEFVHTVVCCAMQVSSSILALTSDPNLTNNVASVPVQPVEGSPVTIGLPTNLAAYRSDEPGPASSTQPPTADPSLTVWIPQVQTFGGNIWYFDSWHDGSRDDPRTFDASNGISGLQGETNFHSAFLFGANPASLDLVALPGKTALPQTVTLVPPYGSGVWTIGKPAASWLKLSTDVYPGGGRVLVTGTADLTGLAPGDYQTTFPATLTAVGVSGSRDVPVTLRILKTMPAISPNGVVNAASYQPGPLSQLEIINIFGTGLGPSQLVQAPVPQAGSLPTELAGTSVEIQGQPTELLYVQDKVVAAIVPNNLYVTGASATVTVKLGGAVAASASVSLPYGSAPALFTRDSSGTGIAAAVNTDGTINSTKNPAKKGSVVLLYATGFELNEQGLIACWGIGHNFGALFPVYTYPVETFIAGERADVLYSGSAPGLTCGLQQINVLIPDDSATGPNVPIQLSMPSGGELPTDPVVWYSTQSHVTIAIK